MEALGLVQAPLDIRVAIACQPCPMSEDDGAPRRTTALQMRMQAELVASEPQTYPSYELQAPERVTMDDSGR